jgi:hypothetical protein
MKRALLILVIAFTTVYCSALLVENASMKAFLYGNEPNSAYSNWVSHLAEGIAVQNYNIYAPYDPQTNGFGDFRLPSTDDATLWNNMLDLFCAEDYDGAQAVLTANSAPYQVVQFNDTDTGRTYYVIREIPNSNYTDTNGTADTYDDEIGAFTYGWGLFIYNPAGTRPIIITIPHPCDDFATPAFGLDALNVWNAKYLLINGAGREVRWTNVAPYTNTKSLSDPTRNPNHPFQTAYKKFADKVRDAFNWREFSPQIHSYDWNLHRGYPNCQISAGYQRYCPNLPIRDLSLLKHDLINRGDHLMIPANTVGIHEDVYLNDFYSVNYSVHDFTYTDGEHTYAVNDAVDLPAYSQNQQMLYTLSGWTDYDSYEPFFHMEMDELPSSYAETQNNYKWFYGWNEAEQQWDMDNLFTHFMEYYDRWLYDMESLMDEMFAMNDNIPPSDPSELTIVNQSLTNVTLGWNRSYAYDFQSYEVLYATEPITIGNFQIFDRSNNAYLASQGCEGITVTGLNNANQYYFKLRAVDKNGVYSNTTNEVTTILAPANVTYYTAHGMDASVRLYWQVGGQTNNQGFKVYRKQNDGDYVMVDSWLTNPNLSNATASTFEWWDYDVANDEFYTYKISSTNLDGVEFFYNYPAGASPRAIHYITIRNTSSTLVDSVAFANNPYASDGQDVYYDEAKNNPGSTYVWNAFWEQYWGNSGTQLAREVKGGYDPDSQIKTWVMRTRSDQTGQSLYISASDNFPRAEKLYLLDGGNGTYHNLLSGPYQYTNNDSNIRTMTLYWGNMQPRVLISGQPNQVYQGGGNITFSWNYQYPFLVDHLELSIQNGADSLLVSSLVGNSVFSFNYLIPQLTDMQNCRLVIDQVAVDGQRTRFWSDYTFAMVPLMVMAYNEGGWKMRSNVWSTGEFTIEQVFGPGSTGYTSAFGGVWAPATDFDFGVAYWIYNPDINFYSSTYPIQGTEYTFELLPGWNFIPNPHLCAYDIEDLRFTLTGNLFSMGEMLAQQLVSPAVYVYRDGVYQAVRRIEPFESFLIKYYGGDGLTPMIDLLPFNSGPDIYPQDPQWKLKVTATQAGRGDVIELGAQPLATDEFDFTLDLPKQPYPPFDMVRLWFPAGQMDRPVTEHILSSSYRPDFDGDEQVKIWDFLIETQTPDPVTFTFDQFDIPDGWQIKLVIGDQFFFVGDAPEFVYTPSETGTHDGYIRVSNYQVSNSDLVNKPLTGLTAYPNPFNPEVNIAFNLLAGTEVEVDIYNIRGQKVKRLHQGLLSAGNHRLVWNGRDGNGNPAASGIYFARVHSKRQTQTLKMMLMK